VAAAFLAARHGYSTGEQQRLIERARGVREGGVDLSGIGDGYPPLPTLLALVMPSSLALGVCNALFGGVATHAVWERLVRRSVPARVIPLLLASIVLVPASWFAATEYLAAFAALTFLLLGLDGFVRFAVAGETEGAFTAGLMLGAAALCDLSALYYALALGAAAPLLARHRFAGHRFAGHRFAGQPAAGRAVAAVLIVPCLLVLAGWVLLEWRFAGSSFTALGDGQARPGVDGGAIGALGSAAVHTAGDLCRAPVFVVSALLLFQRRPTALAGLLVPVAVLVAIRWTGLGCSPVIAFLLLATLGLVTVAFRIGRREQAMLCAAAVAQIVVAGMLFPPSGAALTHWLHTLA
jgi:hypothetical protein